MRIFLAGSSFIIGIDSPYLLFLPPVDLGLEKGLNYCNFSTFKGQCNLEIKYILFYSIPISFQS